MAKLFTIVAPTGGLNKKDPLVAMPAEDAVVLDNMDPKEGYCQVRPGSTVFCGFAANQYPFSLYTFKTAAGVEAIAVGVVGASAGIYSVSAAGVASSIYAPGGAATVANFQATVFKNNLVMACTGMDPQHWNGVAAATTATAWTGPTLNTLANVAAYKSRLYYVQGSSTSIWYGPVDQLPTSATALVQYDVGSFLTRGGAVIAAMGTTKITGFTNAELFVIISNQGEILVYEGDYPGSTTWSIIGHFYVGHPVGYRCGFYIGGDLHIITSQGIFPMSEVLNGGASGRYRSISDKIDSELQTDFRSYQDYALYPQGLYVPEKNMTLINSVRDAEGWATDEGIQYRMNNLTGAWSRWKNVGAADENGVGYIVRQWAIYKGELIFTQLNSIYKMADGIGSVPWRCQHAYTILNDPYNKKAVKMVQPLMSTPVGITLSIINNIDFNNSTYTGTAGVGSVVGNASFNQSWFGLPGLGRFQSLEYRGTGSTLQYVASNITFESGGIL